DNKVVKLLGTGMDVTEQKLAETRVMKALVEGQDIERNRIADDLHDSLGQKLSAIKMMAERILSSEDKPRHNLEKFQHGLDEAIEEVRNISHGLKPSVLEDFGLRNALEDMCSKFTYGKGPAVQFRSYNVKDKIAPSVEFGIFRIAQELLNNA